MAISEKSRQQWQQFLQAQPGFGTKFVRPYWDMQEQLKIPLPAGTHNKFQIPDVVQTLKTALGDSLEDDLNWRPGIEARERRQAEIADHLRTQGARRRGATVGKPNVFREFKRRP